MIATRRKPASDSTFLRHVATHFGEGKTKNRIAKMADAAFRREQKDIGKSCCEACGNWVWTDKMTSTADDYSLCPKCDVIARKEVAG